MVERSRTLVKAAGRRIRFRFADPMMQPFVIIHEYSNGNLTNQLLEESKGRTKLLNQLTG
jgi:hypothetical protein